MTQESQTKITALMKELTDVENDVHCVVQQIRILHVCSKCGQMHTRKELQKLDVAKVVLITPGKPMPSGACRFCGEFCYPNRPIPEPGAPIQEARPDDFAGAIMALAEKVDALRKEIKTRNELESSRLQWNKDKQRLEALNVLKSLIMEAGPEGLTAVLDPEALERLTSKLKKFKGKKGE